MDSLNVKNILGRDGSIARRIAAYEEREEQLAMAEGVAKALRDKKHLVVEAGTGVGKSFAYLVPAILYATAQEGRPKTKTNDKLTSDEKADDDSDGPDIPRIVISTHTISLQEQLIAKDLPLLNSVIPREFSSVLVKGRGNYISLRRMQTAISRAASLMGSESENEQLQMIRDWSKETTDGSRATLPMRPLGSVWDEVSSDSSNCLGRQCPTYNKCFYYQARRRTQHAQILVVNHALFFSDLALRELGASILPDYAAVVFDECHTMEAVASDHLGISVSNSQIDYTLRKLYNPKTDKGLLVALGLKTLSKKSYDCMEALDDMVADIANWYATQTTGNGRVKEKNIVPDRLTHQLKELAGQVERYGKTQDNATVRQDLASAQTRLVVLADSLAAWLKQEQSDSAYWVEQSSSRFGTRVVLRCAH